MYIKPVCLFSGSQQYSKKKQSPANCSPVGQTIYITRVSTFPKITLGTEENNNTVDTA